MGKYIFQTGGETPQQDNFFSDYLGMLEGNLQQQDQQEIEQGYSRQAAAEQEDDSFISNLKAFDEEQETISQEEKLQKMFDTYSAKIDERMQYLDMQAEERDLFSEYDEADLTNTYDTRINATPYFSRPAPVSTATTKNTGRSRNNYGNIRSADGSFANYDTPEQGRQALIHQLNLYKTGKTRNPVKPNSTLYEAMAVYAPAADRNNPKHYAEFIAKRLGISPTTQIQNINVEKWADAVAVMEGNKNIGN